MISISTQIFDPIGVESFSDTQIVSLTNRTSRRVTSVPTLDSDSYVSDLGYSDTDKILKFGVLYLSAEIVDNLTRITKLHSRIWISLKEGIFVAVIKNISYTNGKLSLDIVIVGAA